jgi:hypothetical protein
MEIAMNFDQNPSGSTGELIGVISVVQINPIIFEPKNNVFYTPHVAVDRVSCIVNRKS